MGNDNNSMICKSVSENQRGNVWLSNHPGNITTGGGKPGQGYPCILSFQPRLQSMDIQDEHIGTLLATDYKGERCLLAMEPINYAIDSMSSNSMKSSNPHSGIHKENYVKTIDTNGNNPACNQGGNMIVYALQGNMIGWSDNAGPRGKGYKENEMYTINTVDRHGIMIASPCKGEGDDLVLQPMKLRVRKITEREALRLMGLPPDWFDGADLPKTRQYQIIGNGLVTGKDSYFWYMWQNIYNLLGKKRPTVFSQFSGTGMTEYITDELGFFTAYASEIDESANKAHANLQRKGVLDRRTRNLGDITEVSGYKIRPCDVIFSSSPCQSFSHAGKMEGEDGESGLIWETIRTAREMLEATNGRYPSVIATENVAGELSHKHFLTKFLIALDRMGYAIDIQLHNALDYNVAQSRERVAIVAIKKELVDGNNFEEYRHNRVQRVLKKTNADIQLFSGIATFPHEPKKAT
ncbi:MAG: hypothetical protein GX800_01050 [Clostridiaceae bacterium]|nr:hypothetical protein [Clostridiaceae bacterium]